MSYVTDRPEQIAAKLLKLAKAIALKLSSRVVRDAYKSILAGNWERRGAGEWHCRKPYPMGVYDRDQNIYYARGWGCHEWLTPWERWLLRTALRTMKGEAK